MSHELVDMQIRARVPGDIDGIVAVARRVAARDQYPIYDPPEGLAAFFTAPEMIASWVAVVDGDVVGHVALHDRATDAAMAVVAASGPPAPPAYISRLLADPDMRGRGVGAALLDHARGRAVDMGHAPFLEALDVPGGAPALALYRARGWRELAQVTFDLTDDGYTDVVFAAPDDDDSASGG